MQDLSLHILDILENSARAGATRIDVAVTADITRNKLIIRIEDNGSGMDATTLEKAQSPFYTDKIERARKVGLGIPLFRQQAEQCGGGLTIDSELGKGTVVEAIFAYDDIDRMPMGKLDDSILTAVLGHLDLDLGFRLERIGFGKRRGFRFDTAEIKEALGDVPLSYPDVVEYMEGVLAEGMQDTKMIEA